ncbi:hypothetical protein E2C01_063197 [Portunus trituberculatus]|uniref:Uncharacterized protein n=1 Tax=Portunus trituberculatus TaxID=210409 RepID=A0A5B7HK53_PORTR|nr:hypothetical protein [Portunus trituberculatus]
MIISLSGSEWPRGALLVVVVVVVVAGQSAGETRCPESPVADGTSHSPQQMGGREGRQGGKERERETGDESERPLPPPPPPSQPPPPPPPLFLPLLLSSKAHTLFFLLVLEARMRITGHF